MAGKRSAALELAVLGILAERPLHGYELRKHLVESVGLFETLSFGVLYPALQRLVAQGWITETDSKTNYPRRNRIVYALTDAGRAQLDATVSASSTTASDDAEFAVRITLFGRTAATTRLRVLEERRGRLQRRVEQLQDNLAKRRERLDAYTLELQQHGLDALEREVAWLGDMISREQSGEFTPPQPPPHGSLRPRTGRPKISTRPPQDEPR